MITSSGKQNDKEVEISFVYFMTKLCLFHADVHVCHIEIRAKVKISLPAFPQ